MNLSRTLLAAVLVLIPLPGGSIAQDVNIALGRPASASGETWAGQVPENLTDGNLLDQSHPIASTGTLGFYFEIDLEGEHHFDRIVLHNRTGCCPERLTNYRVSAFADGGGSPGALLWSADIRTDGSNSGDGGQDVLRADLDAGGEFSGRFIRIINRSGAAYNPQIAEVEVFAAPLPVIELFGVDHGNITRIGNPALPTSATLSWRVGRYDSIAIDHGIGAVAGPAGSRTVTPASTTVYTLTAANGSGTARASVTVGVDEPSLDPWISEFMADNTGTLEDEDGDDVDWIEIHNPNIFTVNLGGYFLTDDPAVPALWRIPAISVPAKGYLVVLASGKDRTSDPRFPHANFELARYGEYLALVAPDGRTPLAAHAIVDPETLQYPPQAEDIAYGVGSDGRVGFLGPATPGAANGPAFDGFVEDTTFLPDRALLDAPVDVEIGTATPGATIRYTTDSSEPAASRGKIYSGPIRIARSTVLRAAAFKEGFLPTNVDTQTYIFPDDIIASPVMNAGITGDPAYAPLMRAALTDLPSVSLVASGINDTSEVRASLEWIDPEGASGFQEDAGVVYYGGAFTAFAKKNFRFYFRGIYGARKLRYPLFAGHERGVPPVEAFDCLELRAGSHDMVERGFYMSNRFTDDTMLDMGNLNPHGRFVHLYLNGTYWGQYHLRERWNADMLAQYLGGEKEDYEAINGNWNVGGWADPGSPYDGDGSAWERIKSLRADYEAVKDYLDVPHYIDYMLTFLFGDAEMEYRCVGPKEAGSGFKFFLNDADGFLRTAGDRTVMGKPGRLEGDGPGSIFSMLFAQGHPDYLTLLGDRIHRHYFGDGAMTTARCSARLLDRCAQVERSIIAECARWGYRTPANWKAARDAYLANILPSRTAAVIGQLRGRGLYPALAPASFSRPGGHVDPGFRVVLDAPAGAIYYTVDGSDPRLPGGAVSPGAATYSEVDPTGIVLVGDDAAAAHVPLDGALGTGWTDPDFPAAGWLSGPGAGVGFCVLPAYLPFIDLDVSDAMKGKSATVYIRYEFVLDDPTAFTGIALRMRYDDGYAAYLNGTLLASRNAPAGPVWNSEATLAHADAEAMLFEEAEIVPGAPEGLLRAGRNVLAVHGLNRTAANSDLLIEPELSGLTVGGGAGIRIERTGVVKARVFLAGAWSPLSEGVFALDSSALRVTELMYHPPAAPEGSGIDREDLEFIELQNTGDRPLNLTGIRFASGVSFTFPDTDGLPESDLEPGEVILLVKNLQAFGTVHDTTGLRIAGEYGGRLENAGERILIEDRLGAVIADFTYADDWHPATDGEGRSLEIIDPAGQPAWWGDPRRWRASALAGGSPGSAPPAGGGGLRRPGDLNGDGGVDIGDAIGLLLHLFAGPAPLPCGDGTLAEEGNRLLLDAGGDGAVDLSDAVGVLRFLFLGGAPPALGIECVPLPGCPEACS